MDQRELNKILELHGKWLRGGKGGLRANLKRANLRGKDLSYADLSYANLSDADLRGVDFRGANLRRANLNGADLNGADLSYANLDFSCLPLWCGSLQFKLDEENLKRLVYHTLSLLEHNKTSFKNAKEFANSWEGVERHDIRKIGDK